MTQQLRRRRLLAVGAIPIAVVVALFCITVACHIPYSQPFDHPKARVLLTPPIHDAVSETLAWMEEAIPADGRVAVIPASPIYYFLADRPIPHRYAVLLSPNIAFDRGAEAARLMEEGGVDYVVLGVVETPGLPDLRSYAPILHGYLEASYRPVVSRRFRGSLTTQILVRDAKP
jgi:hypothetical protein